MTGLACGIVGLPNVGKSTLFNALTGSAVAASNYPFCTIDPNVGVVKVPDARLQVLAQMSKSEKILHATTSFVDIAGLVAGAAKGEGLGNKFLANIRETDAIVHVVRCFENQDVVHVAGHIDPISDIEVINLELVLADMQMCEHVLARLEKQSKGKAEGQEALKILKKVWEHLNKSQPVRSIELGPEQHLHLAPYNFLTAKKVLYVANVSENDLPSMENPYVERVRLYAQKEKSMVVPICATLESEIAVMENEEDRREFLQDMGLKSSGLDRLITSSFELLGLITYLTTGEKETRAWTIFKGSTAVEAAGKIHTDIQKGFIRAEVVSFEDMVSYNGRSGARDAGKLRIEGRDYIVKDGDVLLFLHN